MSSSSSIKTVYENLPKSGVVNVYGPSGTGKTTFFNKIKHVKVEHDILKSKETTIHFMDLVKYSLIPVVLDSFELVENQPGVKELKKIKSPFYIVSLYKISIDCITNWFEFPGVCVEDFASTHGIDVGVAKQVLEKNGGNMASALIDIENNMNSDRDLFMDSKQYIERLINGHTYSDFVDKYLAEHGNTMGIVHENYVDYTDNLSRVTHSLSDADLIDMVIYSEVSWDLMHYFNVCACIIPCTECNGPVKSPLRPGSIWTKASNMLMKQSRLKKLRIHRDYIELLTLKANQGDPLEHIKESYDLDSINQLSFTKIKPRVLNSLKKKCRESK